MLQMSLNNIFDPYFYVTVILIKRRQPSSTLGTDIGAICTQHCPNIVVWLDFNDDHQFSHNIHTMLPLHCSLVIV